MNNGFYTRIFVIGCIASMWMSGCAKPLEEIVDMEETKKIVKKTTNINKESDYYETSTINSDVVTETIKEDNSAEESLNSEESKESEKSEESEEIKENKEIGKGAVNLRVNKPRIDKNLGITDVSGGWGYGITPIIWKYIEPNTKIISNTRPNSSTDFSNKSCATSGEYGCFIPCFSKGSMRKGVNWTGEMCCFEELKDDPYSYTYGEGLNDIKYKDITISELISKTHDITEVTSGLFTLNGEYINIIYCDELDEIINIYY